MKLDGKSVAFGFALCLCLSLLVAASYGRQPSEARFELMASNDGWVYLLDQDKAWLSCGRPTDRGFVWIPVPVPPMHPITQTSTR